VIDQKHRQYSEDRDRERHPNRAHALLLRLIGDHSNTSPDVSFQIPMMRGEDGSGF
jgi:hypothetical protein